MSAKKVLVAVAVSGDPLHPDLQRRAEAVGKIIAELGCSLLTGGGVGGMEVVARSFCTTPYRSGQSLAILPGEWVTTGLAPENSAKSMHLDPKPDYPNRWVELPIRTHLQGMKPTGDDSRNILNMGSADIVVFLPGGKGTPAECELARELEKPTIAWLEAADKIGIYEAGSLPDNINAVASLDQFRSELTTAVHRLSLARPTFAALRAVYSTDPTSIHACSMTFPNTCAIRMSEALIKTNSGLEDKFVASGANLCPHHFMRGAEDLASVLRRADAWGVYDRGYSAPMAAPAALQGKAGLLAYINIPSFSGQGHIDLWDGRNPIGNAYWDANPTWFWELL
jgi:predicted Rossmann-fold nucleotide-binding protein